MTFDKIWDKLASHSHSVHVPIDLLLGTNQLIPVYTKGIAS